MSFESIVISGQPGSGKSSLAKGLCDVLGWERYSVGGLWRARHQESTSPLSFDEWWSKTSREDNRRVDQQTAERISHGRVVVELRYARLAEGIPSCLRVLAVAARDVRIQRMIDSQRYPGLDFRQVGDRIYCRETDEIRVALELYSSYDHLDPAGYHVCVNTALLGIEQEIAIVREALRSPHNP